MKYKIVIGLMLLSAVACQDPKHKTERNYIRSGNKLYESEKRKDYTGAEIDYRKALEENPNSSMAMYNLGNALFQQNKLEDASKQYQLATQKDSLKRAEPWHNLGNIFMKGKEYAKSIEMYKQSLRQNPNDDSTRYNLRLAQLLLKNQQQENQDQDKDKDKENKDQDKNKDQQKKEDQQDQNQQNKDKQDQQDQQDQKKDQEQQQQQSQGQMSKENAQQILDAMQQDEKETQERVQKALMQQQKQKKTDKEW